MNDIDHQGKEKNPPVKSLRIMLENSQEAIKVVQDKKIKYANKKSAEIYGYTCEEMIHKHMLDMIYPADHEMVMNNHIRRIGGEEVLPYPYRIVDKKGNVKWIEVSAVLTEWEGRQAIITFITDISRRVHAEEELKRSQRLLYDIINFLPDATFVTDLQGTVIIWNKRMEEMLGIKAEEMIGKNNFEHSIPFHGERRPALVDLLLKPDAVMEGQYSVFKREENSVYAEFGVNLNRKYHWLRASASLVYDHNEHIVGAIESIRDMTDLKIAENELKNYSLKLEEANTELAETNKTLEETNTALKVLLKHREKDKSETEEKIVRNIKELVFPYIEKLKITNLSALQKGYVTITEEHLNEIVSTFLSKMGSKHPELTPREVQIISLVRDGHTTKEIADFLNIEVSTINNHRRHIRRKMRLCGKDINLRSYLLSFPESA